MSVEITQLLSFLPYIQLTTVNKLTNKQILEYTNTNNSTIQKNVHCTNAVMINLVQ